MNKTLRFAIILLTLIIANCSKPTAVIDGSSCAGSASFSTGTTVGAIGTTNVVPVMIGCGYANQPCVSVKICVPGFADNAHCQVIDNILLDTGSYGLRVYASVLKSMAPTFPSQTLGGGKELAECVAYADGSSDWGPVVLADVYLAGEMTSTGGTGANIQLISPNYSSTFVNTPQLIMGQPQVPCGTPDASPAATGFNGIMGIGLFQWDCDACTAAPGNDISSIPYYAQCDAGGNGTCTVDNTVAIPSSAQVTNPIALLPTDNNGTILQIATVSPFPTSGTTGIVGNLILGIDTGIAGSNNDTSVATGLGMNDNNMYLADPTAGVFTANFNSTNYPDSFYDSGSNLWDFDDSGIPWCTGALDGTGVFCPGGTISLSAFTTPFTGAGHTNTVTFPLTDGTILCNGNNAYNNVGAEFSGLSVGPPDSFDFGLPFYFGRNVVTGILGRVPGHARHPNWGNGGANPYWAWK